MEPISKTMNWIYDEQTCINISLWCKHVLRVSYSIQDYYECRYTSLLLFRLLLC